MRIISSVAVLAMISSSAFAQEQTKSVPTVAQVAAPAAVTPAIAPIAAIPAVAPVAAAPTQLTLPANTEVTIMIVDGLNAKDAPKNAKTVKIVKGSKFKIVTADDVAMDGFVAIPKGTSGDGTVTFMAKPKSFGKSGQMEVSFDQLDLNGQQVPLSGKFRQEGKGNGGAAIGAVVAIGIVGGFLVKGHRAEVGPTHRLRARTVNPLIFATTSAAAPSAK